ncbi:MAG: hypothetical protein AB7Q29_04640 [Vicinamibacterales bacterium]
MTADRRLAIGCVGLLLCAQLLYAQPGPRYRQFQLGGDLSSVSALTGVAVSEVKTVHERPALIQELQWRLPYAATASSALAADPVRQIAFSFFSDQLFRIVIDYELERTKGMTDADMIEAISSAYGAMSEMPDASLDSSQTAQESWRAVARWGDADASVVLYRSSYGSAFRMIVTSLPLDALARAAAAEAVRLDERDAPSRETARQQKVADDARAAQEKARLANKAGFRP